MKQLTMSMFAKREDLVAARAQYREETAARLRQRINDGDRDIAIPVVLEHVFDCNYEEACAAVFSGNKQQALAFLDAAVQAHTQPPAFAPQQKVYFGRGPFEFVGIIESTGPDTVSVRGVELGCNEPVTQVVTISTCSSRRGTLRVIDDAEFQAHAEAEPAFNEMLTALS